MSAINQTTKLYRLALSLITLLARTWLGLWRLPELPPGFYHDEARNVMNGLWMGARLTPQAYFVGNAGRWAMMPYLIALSLSILSATPLTARPIAPLVLSLTLATVSRKRVAQ